MLSVSSPQVYEDNPYSFIIELVIISVSDWVGERSCTELWSTFSRFLFYLHIISHVFSTVVFFMLMEYIFRVAGVALRLERFEDEKYEVNTKRIQESKWS